MENASKALIIAGAILLAIAIIGVGMYVFNNASDSVEGSDLSEEEVIAYNGDFDPYAGEVRGSNVKTLIDTVNNHNLTAIDDTERIQIIMNGNPAESTVDVGDVWTGSTSTDYFNNIKNNVILDGATYEIAFAYDSHSGLITTIYILDSNTSDYYDRPA